MYQVEDGYTDLNRIYNATKPFCNIYNFIYDHEALGVTILIVKAIYTVFTIIGLVAGTPLQAGIFGIIWIISGAFITNGFFHCANKNSTQRKIYNCYVNMNKKNRKRFKNIYRMAFRQEKEDYLASARLAQIVEVFSAYAESPNQVKYDYSELDAASEEVKELEVLKLQSDKIMREIDAKVKGIR